MHTLQCFRFTQVIFVRIFWWFFDPLPPLVLPDVAKNRQRGSKAIPGRSNGFQGGFQGGFQEGFQRGLQGKVLPDVTKSCQRGSKGRCYQMWQKVAKGVPRGSQAFHGVPRSSKAFQGPTPGDLRAGTLCVRGARLGSKGP